MAGLSGGTLVSNSPVIVVADDHPLFRDALQSTVSLRFPGCRVVTAGDLTATILILEEEPEVDLVLLDLNMPGVQGFSGLIFLRGQFPVVPVVVVSAREDTDTIRRCISLGASGFIPKSSGTDVMRTAIQQVMNGGVWVPEVAALEGGPVDDELLEIASRLSSLTPQQMRVLMMLKEGLLNKQIAYELTVSEATVKAHVSAILQKLEVNSRTQAVIVASRIALPAPA
ncbi:MAG: response regulator transcription factor [Rhizobiales bacterium]|nr:response regulator transcription factor [Hyphomicrobiales bacterium]